jgi:pre-mRNA-splicing factor ATP-dependent RNA helicase DHX16
MEEEGVGPAKVVEKKKEKKQHTVRHRKKSPRRAIEHRPKTIRQRENDNFEDRWGDEEYVSEEEPEI